MIQESNALIAPPAELPAWAKPCINLADPRLGASAEACSDDFFAAMSRLLNPDPACFIPGKYDGNGKWMDGWETRRKRGPGNDWCIVRLGCPGTIAGFDLDTSFFTGNYPPAACIEACPLGADVSSGSWVRLTGMLSLAGNRHHLVPVDVQDDTVYSHVRVQIFPDGGLARLRVYGRPTPDRFERGSGAHAGLVDLVATRHGGRAVAWNDAHYGAAANLLLPGRGKDMGDGWETRRRREPGHDWCILALGAVGEVLRVEVDTAHFKGNFPDRCSLQAAYIADPDDNALITQSQFWATLLPESKLEADAIAEFAAQPLGRISHVRFNLHPDGGVSRLRLWGKPERGGQ